MMSLQSFKDLLLQEMSSSQALNMCKNLDWNFWFKYDLSLGIDFGGARGCEFLVKIFAFVITRSANYSYQPVSLRPTFITN